MIKIVINGRFLTQSYTGVQNFSLSYTSKLYEIYNNKLIVIVPKLSKINKELDFLFPVIKIGINRGHLWEQLDLPFYLKTLNSPLLINLGNSGPIYYSNKLITIHDLSIYKDKGWHNAVYRLFYKFLTPKIISNCHKIITVSNFSKKELINKFKNLENIIIVVSNTVKKESFNEDCIRKREPYFLFVGTLNKRKNLSNLVKAMNSIKNKNISLKIVGVNKEEFYNEFGDIENIQVLGNIYGCDLNKLYKNSNGLIFPSHYEGFGIPIIEAMLHKCPVLCSDIDVFNEICKGASICFNQNDYMDIKKKILSIYKNNKLIESLINKGSMRVSKYYIDNNINFFKKQIDELI